MAVRWRKYFKECKPVQCGGRKGKYCPSELPHRATGEYKACGVWCIEFFDSNKQWQSLTFKDIHCKSDAEKRLAMFIGDRERGMLSLPKKKHVPTLTEYSKRYLELYAVAKENTLAVKIRTVNTLERYLGDYRLDKITPFVIEKFRIERKEKDRVKDETINADVFTLSHILGKAVKDSILVKNPCGDVKRLKEAQSRDRVLSAEEIGLLLNGLQGKNRLMVLIGLFCGLRLNETLKLMWDNFDFDKGLLSFVACKTGKLITVPLSGYMVKELTNYKTVCTSNNLFESREVNRAVVKDYSWYFSNLFKRLGIHGFTYHCLRHSFASLQGDLGTGAVTVKEMLGHSSLAMTLRYSHTGLDSKKRAVEAMAEHVLAIAKDTTLPLAVQA